MRAAIIIFLAVFTTTLQAQEHKKIIITGSRFSYPLVNKWIDEFKKVHPEIQFHLIPRGTPNVDSANFIINAHELAAEEIRPNYKVVNISRYILLPVANEKNPLVPKFQKEGIEEDELKKLFFKKYDPLASLDEKKEKKEKYKPTLYTREQKACAPTTFARTYGFEQADILGKPIAGDDNHLILAVKKDTNGITYNNLGFIYDRTTRKVQPGLFVIPVDLNGNGKLDAAENFYGTVDNVIEEVEKKPLSAIATGYVNISYPADHKDNFKDLSIFLSWILEEGQKYNHEFGFLNLEEEILSKQKQLLLSVN